MKVFFHQNPLPQYKTQYRSPAFRGKDLLDMPKEDVLSRVKDSVKNQYFIGQGTEAEVYKIKDSDYCVRIPYEVKDLYLFNYSKDLTTVDKLNHTEAKLGFGATIMKYIKGIIPKRFINDEKGRYNLQSKAAEMPVKSYTPILHQIAAATENDMIFDCTGGNIIINPDEQKITAIDFYPKSKDFPRSVKPLTEIVNAITSYGTKHEIGLKIMQKTLLAGLEEFKPNNIPCMDIELFDFVNLFKDGNSRSQYQSDTEKFKEYVEELKKIKKLEMQDKRHAEQLTKLIKLVEREILSLH